jgi:hypothetical protein
MLKNLIRNITLMIHYNHIEILSKEIVMSYNGLAKDLPNERL